MVGLDAWGQVQRGLAHAGVGEARREKLLRGLKENSTNHARPREAVFGEGRKIFLVGFSVEGLVLRGLEFISVEQGEECRKWPCSFMIVPVVEMNHLIVNVRPSVNWNVIQG